MERYDYFGEAALFNESIRVCTVTAEVKTTCLVMTSENIGELLGLKFKEVLFRNNLIWVLEKTKYLKQLTKIQTNKILDEVKI